ncbi:MAG: HAMP domain-containing protein [Nitrospirae bacterium]|nr:HAMP domain-containing protein [Nitrospirota bacterium]
MQIKRLAVPIRIKILISLLLVVTFVVSIITFTMVRLFQKDKTTYVVDLTSFVAQNVASETETLLRSYYDQVQSFARVLYSEEMSTEQKTEFVKSLFRDYEDFIAITLVNPGGQPATVYDARILEEADVAQKDLIAFREANPISPKAVMEGRLVIQNSTVSEKLPSFTLAAGYNPGEGAEPVSVMAVIHLNRLMAIQGRSKVFDTLLVDSNGTLLSHRDPSLVYQRADFSSLPVVQAFLKEPVVAKSLEYTIKETTYLGAFARVNFGGLAAVAQIQKNVAYLTARDLINSLLAVAFAILAVSGIVSLIWSQRLTRPIERLFQATREVAKGQFDVAVQVNSRDEIGQLAGSFNQMASELKAREEALKQAQAALIQSEKMAAFGQLGAGIAHEVKNPLAGILGYAQLAMRKVEKEGPTYKHLEIIEKETRRCKTIIENLLKFARQEKAEFSALDLNHVAEDSVAIVDHQLTINKVAIEKRLETVPRIMGNANQLQQVIMNLMINAQQAMEPSGGKVSIATRVADDQVEIRVSDTGPGISPEIQAKIFEPFFTTKPAGKGTGLGLSVTYGIIRDHNGRIRVESEPGQGATFIMSFPMVKEGDPEPVMAPAPLQKVAGTSELGNPDGGQHDVQNPGR